MKYQALRPQFFSMDGWWGLVIGWGVVGWWGGGGRVWGGWWWGRGGGLGVVMAHEISGIKAPIFLHGWVGGGGVGRGGGGRVGGVGWGGWWWG